jgi:hypothetical protein
MTKRSAGTSTLRLALKAAAALAVFLVCSEAAARVAGLDVLLMGPLLRRMPLHPLNHRASESPVMFYELAPGSKAVYEPGEARCRARHYHGGPQRVTVNSFGFRDPERTREKPAGALRIACVGASTVYGHSVHDEETYPARLEAYLRKALGRPVEVWNGGLSGSVIRQQTHIARRMVDEFSADVVLFMPTNSGRRHFLPGQPYAHFFEEDPDLFLENLRYLPSRSPFYQRLFLRWRAARIPAIAANYIASVPENNPFDKGVEVGELRAFCRDYSPRARIFLVPYGNWKDQLMSIPDAEVLDLFDPENLPPDMGREYMKIHPSPEVYEWYARTLGKQLVRRLGLGGRAAKS